MFKITRYDSSKKDEWNGFVNGARNATFLFDRNYMDYHQDRFQDFSLLFYRDNRLYAVLPGNVDGRTFWTHQGLTYGGLVTDFRATAANVVKLFEELNAYLGKENIDKVIYKSLPVIYQSIPSEEDLYALIHTCHALLKQRDLSTVINFAQPLKWRTLRKRCAKKAEKVGVVVKQTDNFTGFWEILSQNLADKYGVKPVHSLEEMELLQSRFPESIVLYGAYLGEEMVAGTVLYLTKQTIHSQYISASAKGKETGALDLLFEKILLHDFTNYRYFDFGRSTEDNGGYLNENLIFQKEGFGGRAICYDTYEWQV